MKFRNLRADELEARVATVTDKGCSVLIYKDARVDMRILDETVGAMNWQRDHKEINGVIYCGIGIRAAAMDTENLLNIPMSEWVWKWDAGSEGKTEAEKTAASDSFKRAGFNWQIGRALYTSPWIWFPASKINIKDGYNGKPVCYDKFKVDAIEYDEDSISYLRVSDENTGAVFTWGKSEEGNFEADAKASKSEIDGILAMLESKGRDVDMFLSAYDLERIEDMTKAQYADAFQQLRKMKK